MKLKIPFIFVNNFSLKIQQLKYIVEDTNLKIRTSANIQKYHQISPKWHLC